MSFETEEQLIRLKVKIDDQALRMLMSKSLEYLTSWDQLTYEEWDEKVSGLLCEIDKAETQAAKLQNQSLIQNLNVKSNQDLINQIQKDIVVTKQIIEQKENEYVQAQKSMQSKQKFEDLAKEINAYPKVEKTQAWVTIFV